MVVGYNEAKFLEACLSSLWFCEEILYIDLNSTDSSIEIASKYADQIFVRPLAPSGEYIQAQVVQFTKNEWVIFIDPDEKIDISLANQLISNFSNWQNNALLGGVYVPWQFYFKKYKLKGTRWGWNSNKIMLVNKFRFDFKPRTHYGRSLRPSFHEDYISFDGLSNVLHHYWMDSWSIFIGKHMRYLRNEGVDRYNQGKISRGFLNLIITPFKEFAISFFFMRGYRDGLIGFCLSCFWAFYETYAETALFIISKKGDYQIEV